jgi:hypothetical protein
MISLGLDPVGRTVQVEQDSDVLECVWDRPGIGEPWLRFRLRDGEFTIREDRLTTDGRRLAVEIRASAKRHQIAR